MKLVAASAALAAAGAPLARGGLVAHPQHPQQQPLVLSALSEQHSSSSRHSEGDRVFFGDSRCPCIGFDNINGETTVSFEEGGEVAYPADLGSRCEAWDDGRHPASCEEGQKPGLGKGWCAKSWCYVDPCNCEIDVLPKVSDYVPDARYRGKPLFYSYATCGTKDDFTEKVPQVGSPGCRCIGFDNIPGTTEITFEGDKKVAYPAEIGGSCRAWDAKTHPECHGKKPASWCKAAWCYVDPCSCSLKGGEVPKISAYLPKASFTGKSLYYSYETCRSPDTFTEEHHKTACVNQPTKDKCDLNERCAWTGERCLGVEMVDHPLCEGVADKLDDAVAKSGAPRRGAAAAPLAAAAAALVASAAAAAAAAA